MTILLRRILLPLRGLLLPLLLIAAWEIASRQSASHAYAFVPLSKIGAGLLELINSGELWLSTAASLKRTCLGLAYGLLAGFAIGVLMALSRVTERLLGPLYHTLRQVPILGLIPLLALWFGSGEFSKVLIVSLAAFYPMVLNTFEGFNHVDPRYREAVYRVVGRWLKGVFPVSTGIVVSALARPEWLVEIDATAVIPD